MNGCTEFSMDNTKCQYWKNTCDAQYVNQGDSNIYKTTWSSKPDLQPDRCTHIETKSEESDEVFNCRYKNRKDCSDNTLKNPHTCFWTTPHTHWTTSECLNHGSMQLASINGVWTL